MLIVRGRVALGLCTALIASGIALGTGVASAADKNCGDFTSQPAAQLYFTSNGGSPTNNFNNLDRDHNGIACQDYPYPTPGTGTSSSTTTTSSSTTTSSGTGAGGGASNLNCRNFVNQPAAQAFLVADPTDPSGLDGDNDGIACEDYFGDPTGGEGTSTGDDGSTAATSGSQVSVVPEGSADTGSW